MVVCDIHNVKADSDEIQSELLRRIETWIAGITVGRARHDRLLIDKGVIGGGNLIRYITVNREKVVLFVGTPTGFRINVDIRMDEIVPGGDKGYIHAEIRIGLLCRLQRRARLIGDRRLIRHGNPAVGIRCSLPRYTVRRSGRLCFKRCAVCVPKMEAAGENKRREAEEGGNPQRGFVFSCHGGYPLRCRFSARKSP